MSEFIKPKTVFVSDSEYIQNLVNVNLKKDLHDDEEICQHCHGTGMVIRTILMVYLMTQIEI